MKNNFEDSTVMMKQRDHEILAVEKKREKQIQKEMGVLLKKIRVRQGIEIKVLAEKKTFAISTLYNNEDGTAFPTDTMLKKLLSVYQLTEEEKQKIYTLRSEIKTIRSERKKRNQKKRYAWG